MRQNTEQFIDIVFDGPPPHESGRFIEVEDAEGRSINVGTWLQRTDGYWVLRLSPPPTPDVERLTCEWRNLPMTHGVLMPECCDEAFDFAVPATWAREFKFCPYCGKSLKLAVDTPTPGGEQPR